MGIIHQDFVIRKSYFNSIYDFHFSKRKTSPVIATNTELHFNVHDLSRPNKRKFLCWQTFHIVVRFHATSANFTQRWITPRAQNKRKTTTNKSEYSFSKYKNTKQSPPPATVCIRRKKNDYIAIFTKEQTSDKVYRFSDK